MSRLGLTRQKSWAQLLNARHNARVRSRLFDAEEKQPGGRVHDHRVDPFFIHVGQAHVRIVSALAHFGATLERLLRTEQIR